MMDLNEAKRILSTFETEGLEYVLIGSMAMAAQGLVRATRDLDFFVQPTAENVARLKRALKALYDGDPNVDEISAEDLAGDYPVQYVPPHGSYSIDILSRLGEAFRYETLEREELSLDGVRVRVATPAMLYRMKGDGAPAGPPRRGNAATRVRPAGGVMGLRKFRSVEEMPALRRLTPLDPENLRLALGLSSLAHGLRPRRSSPGVRKYRSWDEALSSRDDGRD